MDGPARAATRGVRSLSVSVAGASCAVGFGDRLGCAERERACCRCIYRRGVGGDGGGIRVPLRDRRPLGATGPVWRGRCRGRRQGGSGVGGRGDADCVCRRDTWRTRSRRDRDRGAAAA